MSLVGLIIVLVLIGVLMWAVNAYVPMEGNIKKLLNIVVIIVIILWLLHVFGLLPSNIGDIRVPKV